MWDTTEGENKLSDSLEAFERFAINIRPNNAGTRIRLLQYK